jgi:hypothetical protein
MWLVGDLLPSRLGEGDSNAPPKRLDIRFERILRPTAPPAAPAASPGPAPKARQIAKAASPAASATRLEEPTPVVAEKTPEAQPVDRAPPPVPLPDTAQPQAAASAPVVSDAPAVAAAPDAAASAATAGFEWPPSTRLSYRVTGNYRGPVDGQAQVEWLRSGTRYQVAMEISIGPAFAPLVRRKVISDGEVTAAGLYPRRYDEETRAVLTSPRLLTVFLDGDRIRLPNGVELARPLGVQDSASQFVQLTWLFTTQPQLLQPGRTIEIPLALPRRVETWTYDVVGAESLQTPAGQVDTVHVKPRREAGVGGDLAAEIWVAPTLQYLPVRILIRQNAETYVDLNIEKLPEQAAERR